MKFAPSPFDLLHRRFIYPLWSRKDGYYPLAHLRDLEQTQWWPEAELDRLRRDRLQTLLRHAYASCPHYARAWGAAGVHPSDVRSVDDLRALPTVSKGQIQAHAREMCSTRFAASTLVENRTGGSTGEPLVFYLNRGRLASRAAATIRHNRWAGKDISTLHASLWGHAGDLPSSLSGTWERTKERWVYRVLYLDASTISPERVDAFIAAVRTSRPRVFVAYANVIYYFVRYLEANGIRDFPRPEAVITSAEFLEPERRKRIESVLECPVFDRYGCRETSVIASECPAHDGMHVNAECVHVEVLDSSGRPARPGEPGELVVTDLLNYGMPLIRYRIRDVASVVEGPCSCGRTLPRIRMLGGRSTDFISTPAGRLVSGASLTIYLIAAVSGIGKAQLLQSAVDALTIRVVPDEHFDVDAVDTLKREAAARVGDGVQIDVEVVEEIPLAASGKHRFCISSVDPFPEP